MAKTHKKTGIANTLPGTIYARHGRYWYKAQLPGEAKPIARPLVPLGSKYATTDYCAAVELAKDIYHQAIFKSQKTYLTISTIAELANAYLNYVRKYYVDAQGNMTQEPANIEYALKPLIRLDGGFVYLAAIMDWYSRCVLSWELSNTLDAGFCVEALQRALATGRHPEIFNTDQGSQFTSEVFTGQLTKHGIAISMDGVGHAFDNIMVERLWRTVKYEDVYIRDYKNPAAARFGLRRYFEYYNGRRRHQSLGRKTPAEVYGLAKGLDLDMIRTDGGRSAVASALASVALWAPSPRAG